MALDGLASNVEKEERRSDLNVEKRRAEDV